MGLFGSFFGCSGGDGGAPPRYVSEAAFRENLAKQPGKSLQVVAELRRLGVTAQASRMLEIFFYTDADAKAQALAKALRDLGYDVESRESDYEPGLFGVTGWTTPLPMSEDAVVAWTEKMCRLGYEHDCEFDGWGTDVKQ